jgi:anti-sigma factor RsiW
MFNCKESIDLLVEYLDGNLPADEMRALDQHFEGCPPCVEFLRSYRDTSHLCRHHLSEKMPNEVAHKLTSFLRQRIKK